jgi:hypothetical protein
MLAFGSAYVARFDSHVSEFLVDLRLTVTSLSSSLLRSVGDGQELEISQWQTAPSGRPIRPIQPMGSCLAQGAQRRMHND